MQAIHEGHWRRAVNFVGPGGAATADDESKPVAAEFAACRVGRRNRRFWRVALATVIGLLVPAGWAHAQVLKLRQGDHICLVGNALGERMQHFNYWESLLYARFPELNLVVRNLCFPADEPYNRLRSLNFGSPEEHLRHSQADVILYFFGFNESFAGPDGVEAFKHDLAKLTEETKARDFSGRGPPRVVLISPIAHEDLHDVNVTDGKANNENLRLYTEAMAEVADQNGAGFVDLFKPTGELFAQSSETLTINGVHLGEAGYRAVAPILDRALFGALGAPSGVTPRLKSEIDDKNFHWWHRYRAVNGYYIYGDRAKAGFDGTYRNRDVMERERAILDQMCGNRDERIWALAQGKSVSAESDDSNTLPFLNPKTNVGGPNDQNRKKGKLGSLDYETPEAALPQFKLPEGYQINLFASERDFPELANPVAINFDNQGRLWVAVMPSYPQWKPKTKLNDKLLILEDSNGDGQADQYNVFAEGLHQPTGFELGDGGVYVAQQPDVLFLKDSTGDGQADVRLRELIGFDTADSHHGLSAFEWGPGGGLYFHEGTFKQSHIESPYGPVRLSDAGAWRYEPRTQRFEVHASFGFANPWGHVFDRWGQNFIADASPGNNYWVTPISGRTIYPVKHPGGARDSALTRQQIVNKIPYDTFIVKRVRPTSGCEIVSSRNFPPEAQGNFLVNNVISFRGVLQHTVEEDGAGFIGTEIEPLVESTDGNFRPVDLQFGPDGALYICDWHNALIGHLQHNLRDPSRDHSHGRIWRVTYAGRPLLVPPVIEGQPVDKLLELLKEYEDRTRYRVRRELSERSTLEVIPALQRWIASLDKNDEDHEHHLLEALWLYQTHNVVNESLLKQLLRSPEPRARAAATRVLCYWRDRVDDPLALLRQQVTDSHPRVRLEAVRACSFFETSEAAEVALEVLNHRMDKYLEYTLGETMNTLDRF